MSRLVHGRFTSWDEYRLALDKAYHLKMVEKWELRICGKNRGCRVDGCDGDECRVDWDRPHLFRERIQSLCVQVALSSWIRAQTGSKWPDEITSKIKARLATGVCLQCEKKARGRIRHKRCHKYKKGEYRDELPSLLEKQGGVCAVCWQRIWDAPTSESGRYLKAEVHHVVPFSRGGAVTDPRNLVAVCGQCNSDWGSRLPKCGKVGSWGDYLPVSKPEPYREYEEDNEQ